MVGAKEPVRLRKRKTRTGLTSIYLDIYTDGKRSYEYLRLYLVPEKSRADKEKNRDTMRLAEAVRAKRTVEVQEGRFGFGDKGRSGANLLAYIHAITQTDGRAENTRGMWTAVAAHIERYAGSKTTLRDITRPWAQGFRDYLATATATKSKRAKGPTDDTPLSQNTKALYFKYLRTIVRRAIRDGLLTDDPTAGVEGFKPKETARAYLTKEELQRLAATPCKHEALRRAFLFSCLTGLRKSDILKMVWGEVSQQGGFTRITFRQQKTGGQEYLDITPEAVPLMGERAADSERVFKAFTDSPRISAELLMWAASAGITKHITFHSARHTFAVLMLDIGTDIYTVSKLLGHREVSTTQIYAKMLDRRKQEAVAMIPHLLDEHAPAREQ